MVRRRSSTRVLLPSLLALVSAAPSLAGQETPDSAVEIEPVLVRVLRSTIGTHTPHAVSVTTGAELRRGSAGAFLEESLRAVPGVQIQNRFNLAVGERLSVRGFGPRAQFGIRGVRVLVDGIPATLPDGQSTLDHLDLSSLGRVEVLRGPNATLYGNAAGGVLHFRTLDPGVGPADVSVGTHAGSHGLLAVEGSATGRAGAAGYRVGVHRLEYDGFRRDPVADDGRVYGGGSRTTANGLLTLPAGPGTLRVVLNGVDLAADNPGSLPADLFRSGDRSAWSGNVLMRTSKTVRQGQAGATWATDDEARSTELSTWFVRRELENPIPGTIVSLDRNAAGLRGLHAWRAELPIGTLGVGAGAELELQRDDRLNWENDAGRRGATTLSQFETVLGTGLFAQARLDLPAGVSVLGGMRWDRIRFTAEDRFVAAGDPDDSGSRTMSAVSPSAGLVVAPARDLELFGSIARTFESPTTTELANRPTGSGGFNPDLDPQTGTALEAGVRARLGAAWTAEGTLFRTELEGEMIPFEVPSDPGRQYFRNAGASHHQGWEVAVDGRPAPGLSARVAYTRVDARFDEYVTEDADHSGRRVPGLAPWRIDALASWTRGAAFLETRALYQDEVPVDDAGTAAAPAFFLADVRVGLDRWSSGGLRLSPYVAVSNLLDRRYASSVAVNAFGARYYEPGPGRTFRAGLTLDWAR